MQGISQYVTLFDAPDNTRWSETLHAKLDGRSLPSDHRTLYVYDACSRYDRPALSGKTWRILPQLDESHFTNCIEALFEKKSDQNDVDECFFNANDMLLLKDGRRTVTSSKMVKNVRGVLKGRPSFPKKILNNPIRCVYTNQEFTKDGYVRKHSQKVCKGRISLPDPLENLFLLTKVSASTELRERKYLDLPGTNYTRSLQGLALRSAQEAAVQVKRVAMAAMMKALGKPLAESDQGSTGTDISVGSEKPAQDEEQQDPSAEIEADGVEWFGWAASECFWQEILHLYCGPGGVVRNRTAVVDFTPGCGLLALACARERIPYVAFCLPKQSEALRQMLMLHIMLELVRGTNNGFSRRVLSRARSLNGSHSENGALAAEDIVRDGEGGNAASGSTKRKREPEEADTVEESENELDDDDDEDI